MLCVCEAYLGIFFIMQRTIKTRRISDSRTSGSESRNRKPSRRTVSTPSGRVSISVERRSSTRSVEGRFSKTSGQRSTTGNRSEGRYDRSGKGKSSFAGRRYNKSGGSSFGSSSSGSRGYKRSSQSVSGKPAWRKQRGSSGRASQRRGKQQTIDIAHFINQAVNAPKPKEHIIKHAFADFDFVPEIQENLRAIDFVSPTPIQDQSIPYILDGKDVVGLANTGTGKTGAFLLPLINKIALDRSQKALIIAPTRELAMQIDVEFRKFSRGMKIFSSLCIGGTPLYNQFKSLKNHPNVIIGTPGRLEDLQQRKAIRFEDFHSIVLDEVDRMLDMGFISNIRNILDQMPIRRQSLFFSATMPSSINKFVHEFLSDPITVEVSSGKTAHNVEQDIIRISDKEAKLEHLKVILAQPELEKVLIFSETKRGVESLSQTLYKAGFKVDSIHGDKRQAQRHKSLSRFRGSQINVLVATDVAARGLDIKDVTHVINYTIPQTYDDYVHRIGRTGRGTSKGTALTFV